MEKEPRNLKTSTNITKTAMNEKQQPTSQKPPGGSAKKSTIAGSRLPIARDIEKSWFQGMWMPLILRKVSNRNLLDGCTHLDTPTISITADVLGILGYESPLKSKLGRGKKPSKKN